MWRRIVRLGMPLVLAAAVGVGAGELLGFTGFQQGLWAVSLCLLAVWVSALRGAEPYPIISLPPVGAALFVFLEIGVLLAFFAEPGGPAAGTTVLPLPGMPAVGGPPDVLDVLDVFGALLCGLPAVPFGLAALKDLVPKTGD